MSDTVLKLVPAEPDFVPSTPAGEAALSLLLEMVGQHDFAEATDFGDLMYIDAGDYDEAGQCPSCGVEFVRGFRQAGTHDHLFGVIEYASGDSPEDATVSMPCCGRTVLWRDVRYRSSTFARYQLAVWSPEDWTPPSQEQLHELAAVLGAPVRQVWARY